MQRKNPTSPIRRGFEFQDLWVLKLCIEWLKAPSSIKSIHIETYHDEITSNSFFIDDVSVIDKDENYRFFQLKHLQNPSEDNWTWEGLLATKPKKKGGRTTSILQKWSNSILGASNKEKILEAAFVTNGEGESDIESFVENEFLNIEKLKNEKPEIYDKIKVQFDDEPSIEAFFSEFKFLFKQNSAEDLDAELRQLFYKDLKGTESGYNNLKLRIKEVADQSYPPPLQIDLLKSWGEWDNPKPLYEEFEVPIDFQLFNSGTHQDLLENLSTPSGGIRVITGKPGSGKSTYLSHLHNYLTNNDVVCIRHYYHISPNESNPLERLNNKRVTEALKYQFKENEDALGDLAHQNSENISLPEFLNQIAEYHRSINKSFILIVDGLDHVMRYWDVKELKEFLTEITQPQKGLWILFGTQEVAKQYLPQIVFDQCPEDIWININGVTKEAISEIVKYNAVNLTLPSRNEDYDQLIDILYDTTEGNPLHLRYTLQTLKNQIGESEVWVHSFPELIPYGGEITTYYGALWNQLPDVAKTAALIVVALDFNLSKAQFIDILSSFNSDPTAVSGAIGSIQHLLKKKFRGITIYHNSFELFITQQNEFEEQKKAIFSGAKVWLEQSDFEYLKWAELRRIEYELGNPTPLIEIDRNWLIESLIGCRDERKVLSLMDLATEASFKNGKLEKTIEHDKLREAYSSMFDYSEEAYPKIWELAFESLDVPPPYMDLNDLSGRQIYNFTKVYYTKDNQDILEYAIQEFNDRLSGNRITRKGEIGAEIPYFAKYVIKTVLIDRKHEVGRIFEFIKQYREDGWSSDFICIYASDLLITKQKAKVTELTTLDLTSEEKNALLDLLSFEDLVKSSVDYLETIRKESFDKLNSHCQLYLALNNIQIENIVALPEHSVFPYQIKNHEHEKRNEFAKIYYDNFVLGIVYGLSNKSDRVINWIESSDSRWSLEVMCRVFRASLHVVDRIKEGGNLSYHEVLLHFEDLRDLSFLEDEEYNLKFSLRSTLSNMLKLCYAINKSKGQYYHLDKIALQWLLNSPHYYETELLTLLNSVKDTFLSEEAYQVLINVKREKWSKEVVIFEDRAKFYAGLAQLSRTHNQEEDFHEFLRKSAENLIGYGYRKDMFLYNILQAIEQCQKAGSSETIKWMERISPLIEHVGDYTDGDETRHFPVNFAEKLSKISLSHLFRFYLWNSNQENFYLAEDSWNYIIKELEYKTDEEIQLASTATDIESYKSLTEISNTNEGAKRALDILNEQFGEIVLKPENFNDSYSSSRSEATIDYSSIQPNELLQNTKEQTPYDRNRFLNGWISHWISKQSKKKKIFDGIQYLISEIGWQEVEGEFLHKYYSIAFEYDLEVAFKCLYWGQANDNDWHQFVSRKKWQQQRWKRLSEDFEARKDEFFRKSIYHDGNKYGNKSKYFIPIPRSVEFFIHTDNLSKAEQIVNGAIIQAEALMADLKLPKSGWLEIDEVDEFGILLERLTWPSPLVKERTTVAIAKLVTLAESPTSYFGRLLEWLSNQQIESIIAYGLLPLLKIAENKDQGLAFVDLKVLNDHLPFTTVVIEKLIEELAERIDVSYEVESKRRDIILAPANYIPKRSFEKYASVYVAPIYSDYSARIADQTSFDFKKQWSYTYEELLSDSGMEEDIDKTHFMGRGNGPRLVGMCTKIGELYKSSFLLVLQHLFKEEVIDEYQFNDYSFSTVPVDLSFWQIKSQSTPDWWPVFNKPNKEVKEIDLSKTGVLEQIESLTKAKKGWRLLAMDGAVQPSKGWVEDEIDTQITLIPFAYKIDGSHIPSGEELADLLLHKPVFKMLPVVDRPFCFLENRHFSIPEWTEPERVKDLWVYPLVARNFDAVIGMYQWYRDHHSSFSLFHDIKGDLKVKSEDFCWTYNREEAVFAKSQDWVSGIRERSSYELEIPHGQFIEIDDSYLSQYLEYRDMRLGYLLRLKYNIKRYSHEKVKTYEDYKLINVSKIII